MGLCQSNSAVDDRKNKIDAANAKYLYNDDSNKNQPNSNSSKNLNNPNSRNKNDDGTTVSAGTASRHDKVLEWKDTLRHDGDLATAVVHIETSPTRTVEDVYDGVHNGPVLGSGAAGVVRKCRHKETGMEFAVKCLNIGLIESDKIIETLREEVFIMCQADHPDILRLEEVYESDTQIYLVEDLLTGGDMFDRLEEQPDYHYSEVQCAQIVKQMLSSIRYLHSKKVIHRDLKLENFLFDDEESNNIRLIDFGLSKHFNEDGYKHYDAVGTPYTIAPETIKGEYDEKVDVWALGVITYLLLCGDPPFGGMDGEALMDVKRNILECKLVFEPKEIWDNVSETAKNFVRKLLTEDPNQRISALEAQKDEWMMINANLDPESSKPLHRKLVNNLLKFKDYSTLHKVLLEVVSFTLSPAQIKEMKKEFEKIDRDGKGEITLEDLKEVMLNRVVVAGSSSQTSPAMTEEEVEAIFNSLRLSDKAMTIRWHDFIAAGLSRAEIDIRNLRLAFNRFDHDRKGYITLDDVSDLLCAGKMDKEVLEIWQEGLQECKANDNEKLYFEDFQRLMKGRIKRRSSLVSSLGTKENLRAYTGRSASQRDCASQTPEQSKHYNERLTTSLVLTEALSQRSLLNSVTSDKSSNSNLSASSILSGSLRKHSDGRGATLSWSSRRSSTKSVKNTNLSTVAEA